MPETTAKIYLPSKVVRHFVKPKHRQSRVFTDRDTLSRDAAGRVNQNRKTTDKHMPMVRLREPKNNQDKELRLPSGQDPRADLPNLSAQGLLRI